jgi:dTMP kinase
MSGSGQKLIRHVTCTVQGMRRLAATREFPVAVSDGPTVDSGEDGELGRIPPLVGPQDQPPSTRGASERGPGHFGQEMVATFRTPHAYPGRLIVVEGIDGSGKTTQLSLLAKWLGATGHRLSLTEWNSSALVKAAVKAGKKKNLLTPTTFSLLHATDFADRQLYKIVPALKAGMVVLADRYAYTAFARDVARGVNRGWVHDLYSFAVKPDLAVYFRVPVEVSLERLLARRVKLKFYEAGMDMGWSRDAAESFRIFQTKVLREYDEIVTAHDLQVIDAAAGITEQQQAFRDLVAEHLDGYRP